MLRTRERFAKRLAPRRFLARVMDLIEDGERRHARHRGEAFRAGGDLLIGHDGPVEIAREDRIGVAKAMIELDPGPRHRARELRFEVLARDDDEDARDPAFAQQRVREPRREARLPGSRRRDEERVARPRRGPGFERFELPRTERQTPSRQGTDHPVRFASTNRRSSKEFRAASA